MIYLLFFFSGFSALLYQVAWQRFVALYAGSDSESVALVIAGFLTGVGIGSWVGSRLADRFSDAGALRAFAMCELGIGLCAAISPWFYYQVMFIQGAALHQDPLRGFTLTFISLLPPTILMGLSLPLLAKATAGRIEQAARRVSLLNAVNILGAASGSLVSGWFLVGLIGYDRTVYLGASLSGLIALLGFVLARRSDPTPPPVAASTPRPPEAGALDAAVLRYWCLLVFVSGFVSISLELIWFRVLAFVLGSTPYVFALMLSAILGGYAIGGWLAARWLQRFTDPSRAFLWIQVAVLLVSLWSLLGLFWVVQSVPHGAAVSLLSSQAGLVGWSPGGYVSRLLLVGLILLPPNILIGLCFPVTQKAILKDRHSLGRCVGLVQFANILGNLGACLITGFLLFNTVGTTGALKVLLGAAMIFAVLLLARRSPGDRPRAAWAAVAAVAAGAVLLPGNSAWWRGWHLYRAGDHFDAGEDSSGVAAIAKSGRDASFRMYAHGQFQGRSPYNPYNCASGVMLALAHPAPKNILAIGMGTGGLPHAVGVNPLSERVATYEILRPELPLMQRFARQAQAGATPQALLSDPRYQFRLSDGRRALLAQPDKFDIIVGSPLLPDNSRAGLIYSREFMELAGARLNPGGLVMLWNCSPRTERTFRAVFPHGLKVEPELIIGSNEPVHLDLERIAERIASDPQIHANLAKLGQPVRLDLLAVADAWHPGSPRPAGDINTDLRPLDEYYYNNNADFRAWLDRLRNRNPGAAPPERKNPHL